MGRIDRTWQLFRESYAVLGNDPEILLFPLMSGISVILLGASFFVPLYQYGTLEALRTGRGGWQEYSILFAWYYGNFAIGIFFNGALAACANVRLSGGNPSVGDGLRIAFSRIGRILLLALITATVGLFLRSMRERGGWMTRLLGASLELGWALITYMIVPVILFEDRGVYDSIYRSQELFQKNWGEQLAGSFGFGLLNFLLCLPAFALAAVLWKVDVALAVIMAVCYLLILAILASAVKGVFTVALYRYATLGEAPAGFSGDAIDEALGGRRNARWFGTAGSGY
jgi:hypothetical protein